MLKEMEQHVGSGKNGRNRVAMGPGQYTMGK